MKRLEKYYNKNYSEIAYYSVKTVLIIFILGLIIYYFYGKIGSVFSFVSEVFKPFVLGLVLTYLLHPVVNTLENRLFGGLKQQTARRGAAVLLTFAIIAFVILLILGILVVTVTRSLSSLNITDIKEYLIALNDQFSRFWTTIEKQLASMNINLGSLGDMLRKVFGNVAGGASTLLFAMIFSIYFLLDNSISTYWKSVLDDFTSDHTRAELISFARDADRVFSGYIRGQALDAALVGLLVSVALLIARIPYATVIGILTGVGNLVPYVGPVVGFGSLIIISLACGSVSTLLIGGAILLVVMFVDGNIINPRMLSSNVHVHPVLVIVALLAGGKVGGIVGMLVAVPIAALIKVQFDKYLEKRKGHPAELAREDSDNEKET